MCERDRVIGKVSLLELYSFDSGGSNCREIQLHPETSQTRMEIHLEGCQKTEKL